MKKLFFLVVIVLSSKSAFSQLDAGSYKFSNNEITLNFTIPDYASDSMPVKLTYNLTQKTIPGVMQFMRSNGKASNFMEWYQFQTSECNYDFDVPSNKLVLRQSECKKGQKAKKYQLTRK